MNPCESQSPRKALSGNIRNIPVLADLNLIEGLAVVKDESDEGARFQMILIGLSEINIRENVPIDHHEGVIIPEARGVLDSSPCTENLGLHPYVDRQSERPAFVQVIDKLLIMMMSVHDEPGKTVAFQIIDESRNDGPVGHRHEDLGLHLGERSKPCPQSGCKNHGFHGIEVPKVRSV